MRGTGLRWDNLVLLFSNHSSQVFKLEGKLVEDGLSKKLLVAVKVCHKTTLFNMLTKKYEYMYIQGRYP